MAHKLLEAAVSDGARFVIALVLCVGTIGLLALRIDVPGVLWALDGAAVAFYFQMAIVKSGQ